MVVVAERDGVDRVGCMVYVVFGVVLPVHAAALCRQKVAAVFTRDSRAEQSRADASQVHSSSSFSCPPRVSIRKSSRLTRPGCTTDQNSSSTEGRIDE